MNNETTILFHKIQWFLKENETTILEDDWKQSIKDFIYQDYRDGEFEVECNDQLDSLRWFIDFSK